MSASKKFSSEAVWLVTGCSSGLGAGFAKHIVSSGHSLVATARKISSLSYLPDNPKILKLVLDVTSIPSIKKAFSVTIEKFGLVDVVINNAGYGLMGDTEGATDGIARKQLDTNFWGVVDVSREAVRIFRDANPVGSGGLVVQVTSLGGWVGVASGAFYHASKFAVEGWTEAFAKEMHPDWNIKFLILEPGGIKTEFTKGSREFTTPHPAYKDPSSPARILEKYIREGGVDAQSSTPERVAEVVFDVIVKRDERALPLRLPLGVDSYGMIIAKLHHTEKDMIEWKDVSESAMDEETRRVAASWAKTLGI